MKLERLISVFDKETEVLVQELDISKISLDRLKSIFSTNLNDPLMYNPYTIDEDKMNILNRYLTFKIKYDGAKFIYQLDCFEVKDD